MHGPGGWLVLLLGKVNYGQGVKNLQRCKKDFSTVLSHLCNPQAKTTPSKKGRMEK